MQVLNAGLPSGICFLSWDEARNSNGRLPHGGGCKRLIGKGLAKTSAENVQPACLNSLPSINLFFANSSNSRDIDKTDIYQVRPFL
jgi:hypothetical protein